MFSLTRVLAIDASSVLNIKANFVRLQYSQNAFFTRVTHVARDKYDRKIITCDQSGFNDVLFYDFINLTQVHNFTIDAQYIFTFGRLPFFTVCFTGI